MLPWPGRPRPVLTLASRHRTQAVFRLIRAGAGAGAGDSFSMAGADSLARAIIARYHSEDERDNEYSEAVHCQSLRI